MYELLALGVIAITALFFQQWLFMKERKDLLNRIMARNFEQLQYYDKMFKGEVEELKKDRNEMRKEESEDDEIKKEMDLKYEEEKKFIEQTEEDWDVNDVDLEKLKKKISEE